ncbi:hypothetical protein DPMN_049744 [Dreissena polymorpha]|uniref:Uncharacterized protein n=1 Tax=Dreissena polymorpha TaxID=45954 RepID=A0A9D4CFX9_DREPO|nr:hypothetical protein DPMN_049744 [Dreissena polymorpha]
MFFFRSLDDKINGRQPSRPIPAPRQSKPIPAPRQSKPIPAPRQSKPIPAPRQKEPTLAKKVPTTFEVLQKATKICKDLLVDDVGYT